MDAEVKRKWIGALRSGEYQQGMGFLRNLTGTRYCCLGVLCDLHRKEDSVNREWGNGSRYDGSLSFLGENVMRWAGLRERDPKTPNGTLSALNDLGQTFEDIAGVIERNL